jgi:hypothetical protein
MIDLLRQGKGEVATFSQAREVMVKIAKETSEQVTRLIKAKGR